MKIYAATHNAHKIREIGAMLEGFEVVAEDTGAEETESTFEGNALIKVRAIAAARKGEWCIADDSGLEVDALGGEPGVRSARYAGEECSTPANNALLLKNLEGVAERSARFVCAIAIVSPSGEERVVRGECRGRILEREDGAGGFGYDPLFLPDGEEKSFAALAAEEKNRISHRARALGAAKKAMKEMAGK